jgi:hypothetical protein
MISCGKLSDSVNSLFAVETLQLFVAFNLDSSSSKSLTLLNVGTPDASVVDNMCFLARVLEKSNAKTLVMELGKAYTPSMDSI